ncbi:MAG: potassium channel family protein [Myxococcales bacterium]|nr:potassium channel family protein [Myxococcales bacterium]
MSLVFASGTFGYLILTDGRYSWLDCLYMTVITVSTVGYEQIVRADTDAITLFNIGLILFGGGAILYFISSMTSLILEGDLLHGLFRRRIERAVQKQRHHVVVVGLGRMGRAAVVELVHAGVPVVGVDREESQIGELVGELGEPPPFVVGDALDDDALHHAGIGRASALVAAMPDDRDNLYLTVIARGMNPDLRIVSRVADPLTSAKLLDSGANAVVIPSALAARRLTRELVEPVFTAFNDATFGADASLNAVDVFDVPREAVGASFDEWFPGLHVVGLRAAGAELFEFRPDRAIRLASGQRLIVVGERARLRDFRSPPTLRVAPTSRAAGAPIDLNGRVVIAGGGRVGRQVALDLLEVGVREIVVIEDDAARAETLRQEDAACALPGAVRIVEGSALEDAVLVAAGVPGAVALVAALSAARDNAFLCVTARRMEPRLRIVARADLEAEVERLYRVGADNAASVALIGASRLRDAVVAPELARLDDLVSDKDEGRQLFLREWVVKVPGNLRGATVRQLTTSPPVSASSETGVATLVAVHTGLRASWVWLPSRALRLRGHVTALYLGRRAELERLDG